MARNDLFAVDHFAAADQPDIGKSTTIAMLREEAAGCTRCYLHRNATA